jgi:RNA polymerase sigma-70 factor (ECF subfamily)
MSDRELVARCLAGDEDARQMLYRQNERRLYAMALRLTGSVADAEDVLQESFLRAFRSLESFRGDAALSTWLCRIVINQSRNVFARRARLRPEEEIPEQGVTPALPGEGARLQAALGRLSEGYREVLVMHDVLGMEHHEMAAALGVAEGTCKSQLHKARARMRELLAPGGA